MRYRISQTWAHSRARQRVDLRWGRASVIAGDAAIYGEHIVGVMGQRHFGRVAKASAC